MTSRNAFIPFCPLLSLTLDPARVLQALALSLPVFVDAQLLNLIVNNVFFMPF